jgi:hypothetical protein
VDGGAAASRTWCHDFEFKYPNSFSSYAHAAFSGDGGAMLLGVAQSALPINGTVLDGPYEITLDSLGNPLTVLSLASTSQPDGGGYSSTGLAATALGTSGDVAFGGNGDLSPALLWTYAAGGAPEATKAFTPPAAASGYDNFIASAVPIAGGDFIVAGVFTDGTDFGTGPLKAVSMVDTFVARFSPSGTCRWVSALGAAALDYDPPLTSVTVDAAGHVFVVGASPTEGGVSEFAVAARFDATTGAKEWTSSLGAGPATAAAADGTDLVAALDLPGPRARSRPTGPGGRSSPAPRRGGPSGR